MTDAEFLDTQAQLRGRATRELMAEGVVLPCACAESYCCGWRYVLRAPDAIDKHLRHTYPTPQPSVSAADYVAREQRRRRDRRFTWPSLPLPTNEGPASER